MLYDPDPGAVPGGSKFTRACFPRKRYDDVTAAKCFSNLLAVGFDRFVLDVYWDASRALWSLCPIELGVVNSPASPASSSSVAASNTARVVARDGVRTASLLEERATSILPTTAANKDIQATSVAALQPVTTTVTVKPGSSGISKTPSLGTLIEAGPYACTTNINLPFFIAVFESHLDNTQFRENATIKYLIFDLHVASPAANPEATPRPPKNFPKDDTNTLSALLDAQLSDYLYTPSDLLSQRENLNASLSWYGGDHDFDPVSAYFTLNHNGGHDSTPNGWPSGSFVQMASAKRLLAGFGRVDPQLKDYDFARDASTIFPKGYLSAATDYTANGRGQVEDGCFFEPSVVAVNNVNNSWAIGTTDLSAVGGGSGRDAPTFIEAADLTACGVAPLLNATLNDKTADQDFSPYAAYLQSTIWSWAPGQPSNSTSASVQKGQPPPSSTKGRCAVLNATSGYWQTANCNEKYFSACRAPGKIYDWVLSDNPANYMDASLPCPSPATFSVPATGLENTYLLHHFRHALRNGNLDTENPSQAQLLWLNLNDLDRQSCWVTGQNSACPYVGGLDERRKIVVPVVAAIIVFVLAVLTVCTKCASNRRQAKRRRRRGGDGDGEDRGDYEGVPS